MRVARNRPVAAAPSWPTPPRRKSPLAAEQVDHEVCRERGRRAFRVLFLAYCFAVIRQARES